MIQNFLRSQIGINVQIYIDDIIVTIKKESTFITNLWKTFDNLDKYRIKLNPLKCSFGVPPGKLIRYLVLARGIEAKPEKIQAILSIKKPKNLSGVQQLADA